MHAGRREISAGEGRKKLKPFFKRMAILTERKGRIPHPPIARRHLRRESPAPNLMMEEIIAYISSNGDSICFFFLSAMIGLSALWYLSNFRMRPLAEFRNEFTAVRIYKLDNTVGFAGSRADATFPASEKKNSFRGFLMYSWKNRCWRYLPRGSNEETRLQSGEKVEFFGQEYEFRSYDCGNRKPQFPASFILIMLMIACSLGIQIYLAFYAGYHFKELSNLESYHTGFNYFLSLYLIQLLIFIVLGTTQWYRITPDLILLLFLSSFGYTLFPYLATFISIIISWTVFLIGPFVISKLLASLRSKKPIKIKTAEFSFRDILVFILTIMIVAGAARSGGKTTIQLPIIGQVGDYGLIALMLLSIANLDEALKPKENIWLIALASGISAVLFLFNETGTAATLMLVLCMVLMLRAAAFGKLPTLLMAFLGFAAVFAVAFAAGSAIVDHARSTGENSKIARRIEQWESDYSEIDYNEPLQVQRLRSLAAAGGYKGFGLYGGYCRDRVLQSRSDFIAGVVFEEMGMGNGTLIMILILIVSFGYFFHGVRSVKHHYGVYCFIAAFFIAIRTFVNLASSTGVSFGAGPLKFGIPIVGLPLPFLSRAGAAGVVLFVCLAFADASKISLDATETLFAAPRKAEASASV
ncbi:MAG: FtsW/RodA/SpoVE family cell cycle protein [Clostridiales bacterium]|nr:FtsW/RodA/SpoVE family cell cycle protein [Clostridiales bacterium]